LKHFDNQVFFPPVQSIHQQGKTKDMDMTKNNNPVALASELDNNSFLVPSLGFSDSAAAERYALNRDNLTNQIVYGMDDNFARVTFGDKNYVPRISSIHGQWLISELINARAALSQTKWELLRQKTTPMPSADAFNVCLLVDGPRQFSVYYPRTNKHPNWWYSLHMGNRECFAVWGRVNGQALGKHNPLDGENHIVASSYGRGVIVARTAHFSNSGEPSGFKNIMIKLDFSIKDKLEAKDDMLKVQIFRHLAITTVGEGVYDFAKEEDDNGWKILVERAQQGFALFCETVPKELDDWRKRFIEQKAYIARDNLIAGASYGDQIKKLSWQEALATVHAPWQLQVVIDAHCGEQFDESVHRHSAKYTRVGNMLAAHKCTPERREQLGTMIEDFVHANSDDWNRTGQ
jgi:hypothetical protein